MLLGPTIPAPSPAQPPATTPTWRSSVGLNEVLAVGAGDSPALGGREVVDAPTRGVEASKALINDGDTGNVEAVHVSSISAVPHFQTWPWVESGRCGSIRDDEPVSCVILIECEQLGVAALPLTDFK